MNKDGVIIYQSHFDIIRKDLNPEQIGRLMSALFDYAAGKEPKVDADISIAYGFMTNQVSIDQRKYEEISRKRSEAGKRGGAPKGNQNAAKTSKTSKNKQNKPNNKDNDKDNDNVNVNDNEAVFDDTDDIFKRDSYGTLNNVMLTKEEMKELKRHYENVNKLVDKVSVWLPNSKGDHKYDHYALCLKFAENDNWPKKRKEEPTSEIGVEDPLDPEEQEKKVKEMRARLNGIFA